jgi:hypothetical protein
VPVLRRLAHVDVDDESTEKSMHAVLVTQRSPSPSHTKQQGQQSAGTKPCEKSTQAATKGHKMFKPAMPRPTSQ